MLDPRLIRNDIENVALKLKIKNFELDVQSIARLEEKRKTLQVQTEALQSERNTKSKSIGQAKSRGEDIKPLLQDVSSLGDRLDELKEEKHSKWPQR